MKGIYMIRICRLFSLAVVSSCSLLNSPFVAAQDEEPVSFDRDIRPILSDRCFVCHGPDEGSRAADLRLDLEEESHGFVIEPGSLDDSELWARITSNDESDLMPPPESHKDPLNKEQLDLFKRWIQQGAKYEKFWAFEIPERAPVPQVDDESWSHNTIDRFVFSSLKRAGVSPVAEADSRTLLRRTSLDLTGLPPTLEQIASYLEMEKSKGKDYALEQWVDELIASPRYGEHMSRYWLDLVRFADTNGMHKDFYRNHFAYRDWVIKAFNQNLGYDEFLKQQLAGDLYKDPTKDQLTATAFNRLHLIIDRGTALPEESFHKNVVDRVTAVSTAFLGLTAQCAQCHDHKYDPITQKDFYSLYAFFNNIDADPETVSRPKNGLQAPFVSLADKDQALKLKTYNDEISSLREQLEQLDKELKVVEPASKTDHTKAGDSKERASQRSQLLERKVKVTARKKNLEQRRNDFDRNLPYVMVMRERSEPRPTFVLNRGDYDSPGEPVSRATPGFLPPMKLNGNVPSRLDLANWFVDPSHPLTGRVAVNRIWQQLFGTGLVKTAEDFGAQGDAPSHPKLLDALALDFVESGWDTKALVKQIVMSKSYRQQSTVATDKYLQDPDNRKLARGSRYRMDAEMIRDQILFTSGLLSGTMYGPSVKPPQPDGLWKSVTMIGERYKADEGESIFRRSVYTYWKRGMPPPQMTILNAPSRDACIARRERTNTPSQALLLLNEPEYMKAARTLARQVLAKDESIRIKYAWERVTCKIPDKQEIQLIAHLASELEVLYKNDSSLVDNACQGLELSDGNERRELAVWTAIINTLFNLDITKNRD